MGPKLEDKYPPMTEEEQAALAEKLEEYEDHRQMLAGQYGGGMWGED